MGWAPRRASSLVVRELGDETLAYDLSSHRASCLNRGAAEVFQVCDGRHSPGEIARTLSVRLGRRVDPRYVAAALERLVASGLVEPGPVPAPGRREVLKRLASAAALALPAVTTVLAPEPAQAQTCLPNGASCTMSSQCCSGCCMGVNMMCSGGGGGCV